MHDEIDIYYALRDKCKHAIEDPNCFGNVSLVVKGAANGSTKMFMGIMGKVVCNNKFDCLCSFDAKSMLEIVNEIIAIYEKEIGAGGLSNA